MLSRACGAFHFDVILASKTRSIEIHEIHNAESGDTIYEEGKEHLKLRDITLTTGTQITSTLAVEPKQLAQTDLFLQEQADAITELKQSHTTVSDRFEMQTLNTTLSTLPPRKPDEYYVKSWWRLVSREVCP